MSHVTLPAPLFPVHGHYPEGILKLISEPAPALHLPEFPIRLSKMTMPEQTKLLHPLRVRHIGFGFKLKTPQTEHGELIQDR